MYSREAMGNAMENEIQVMVYSNSKENQKGLRKKVH
jgi:hypothetical protein